MSRRRTPVAAPAGTPGAAPAGTQGSQIQSSPLASNFSDPTLVYGDAVRVKQDKCRNQIVLIEQKSLGISQCGIILSSGAKFCYILTVRMLDIKKVGSTFITFGDGTKKEFTVSQLDIRTQSWNELSIIFIYDGIETIQCKGSAQFSEGKEGVKDTFIYTMGVVPEVSFLDENGIDKYDPAVVCLTGGNVSFAGLKHSSMDVFIHNCTLGDIAVLGSAVLSESCEIIGINFRNLADSTMALTLEEIKYQIVGLFQGLSKKMTFADIRKHLDTRAQLLQTSGTRSKRGRP